MFDLMQVYSSCVQCLCQQLRSYAQKTKELAVIIMLTITICNSSLQGTNVNWNRLYDGAESPSTHLLASKLTLLT